MCVWIVSDSGSTAASEWRLVVLVDVVKLPGKSCLFVGLLVCCLCPGVSCMSTTVCLNISACLLFVNPYLRWRVLYVYHRLS